MSASTTPRGSPRIPQQLVWLRAGQAAAAAEVRQALTLADEIGLVMRASRRSARLSQRAFAAAHGWSSAQQARVETRATDLGVGQVRWMLSATDYVLALTTAGEIVRADTAMRVSEWLVARSHELGLSTRTLAEAAATTQSVVSRLRSPARVDQVSLGRLQAVVRALGGELRVAADEVSGPRIIDPAQWPVAAVLPRVRADRRRLAAHGWLRAMPHLGGPSWYTHRYEDRHGFGRPPLWTASAPGGSRWPRAAWANGLAPLGAPPSEYDVGRPGAIDIQDDSPA